MLGLGPGSGLPILEKAGVEDTYNLVQSKFFRVPLSFPAVRYFFFFLSLCEICVSCTRTLSLGSIIITALFVLFLPWWFLGNATILFYVYPLLYCTELLR